MQFARARRPSVGRTVIVIEPLAVGTSGRPSRADYSLHAQADRIAAVLDSLGIRHAVLVGHSMGGAILLRTAIRRPDLAAALVLLEAGPAETAASPGFRRAMEYAPMIRIAGMRTVRGAVRRNLERASGNPAWITDEVIAAYTAGASADLGGTLRAYLRVAHAREPQPLAAQLARIRCDVHLLLGAAPHASGPGATEIATLRERLAHFTLDSVPDAGHFLHEEAPVAVVRAILATQVSRTAAR